MSEFHFLRPEYLLLIPCVLLMALLVGRLSTSSNWSSHIAAGKLKLLMRGEGSNHWRNPLFFGLGGLICCLALAGPSWEMRPVPTSENASALVILLDLSPSMLAQDIQPDRLVRSRLKITDLLRLREDGQTALVAYSGSAHRVSPLTDDANTIEALLPALHPGVMPLTGSNIEAALELGLELLTSSGYQNQGHMLVVTDGIEPDAQKAINDMLPAGVKLSILGVGSIEGAPIPLGGGNFYRDSRGDIVLAQLNRNELQILAGRSGGRYIELQPDDSDLNYLLNHIDDPAADKDNEIETTYDSWHDAGYWLIILLIPLALTAFKRDFLFCLPLLVLAIFALPSPRAEAGTWQDLWLTKDQQAQKSLEQGDAAAAAELFKSKDWRAYSSYQAEDFEAAVSELELLESPSLYNLGTSQARSGQLEQALENLNQFVEQNPEHENARYNRDLVEQLLQQQEQQEQQNQQSSDQNQQGESQQDQEGEGQESAQQEQQESQQAQDSENQQDQESQQNAGAEQEQNQDEAEEQQAQAEESERQENEQIEDLASIPELSEEDLSDSSEQWLRAIPDDPSGLLRRKFEYESQLYQQQRRFLPPTSANEEKRY